MKIKFLLAGVVSIFVVAAYAKSAKLVDVWPFSAPGINDKGDIDPKTAGDIVFDTSASKFFGWDGSNWTQFDNTIPSLNVASYSSGPTTYTTTTGDDVVLMSGASCNVALYTASGNSGKVLEIVHNGTSLTQVYTLTTTGGQTVGGIASGSYALYTKGERLKLVSDGSNWVILDHQAITPWTNGGAHTFTATTSNPTKGTTSTDVMWYRRVGDTLEVRGSYVQTGAGTNGSGDILIQVPGGLTIDTTSIVPFTTVIGSTGSPRPANIIGGGNYGGVSGLSGSMMALYDSTRVRMLGLVTPWGAGGNTLGAAWSGGFNLSNFAVTYFYSVPIVGWQP